MSEHASLFTRQDSEHDIVVKVKLKAGCSQFLKSYVGPDMLWKAGDGKSSEFFPEILTH